MPGRAGMNSRPTSKCAPKNPGKSLRTIPAGPAESGNNAGARSEMSTMIFHFPRLCTMPGFNGEDLLEPQPDRSTHPPPPEHAGNDGK